MFKKYNLPLKNPSSHLDGQLLYMSQDGNIKAESCGLPPALKGPRKSECAPARENSPSGQFTKNISEVENLNELLLWCRCDSQIKHSFKGEHVALGFIF